MELEGRAGFHAVADGSTEEVRLGNTGALIIADGHGRYYETAYRRRSFVLVGKSVTVAAANVSPVAATSGQLIAGIFNPLGSGVNIEILQGIVATVSGTPGGPFYWNAYTSGATTTAAATGTILPGFGSSGVSSGSACRPVHNVALAAATPGALEWGVLGGTAAIAAGAGIGSCIDEVSGALIFPPGSIVGIAAHAAGTTHVVSASIRWAEYPI